jgi:hypothetical protein
VAKNLLTLLHLLLKRLLLWLLKPLHLLPKLHQPLKLHLLLKRLLLPKLRLLTLQNNLALLNAKADFMSAFLLSFTLTVC